MNSLAYFVDNFNVEMIHTYPEYISIPTLKVIRDAELAPWGREESMECSEEEESSKQDLDGVKCAKEKCDGGRSDDRRPVKEGRRAKKLATRRSARLAQAKLGV